MSMEANPHTKSSFIITAVRLGLVMIVLCGILYPLVSTGVAQLIFPYQANGSMVKGADGKVVGSELIGQSFTDPSYFQGRVSSIDYNGAGSGSNNYAPSNPALAERMHESLVAWQHANPEVPLQQVPVDLVTNSGSGLDPDISPAAAKVQIPRISQRTGIDPNVLQALVDQLTKGRDLDIFGEPRVNVLMLNLALSQQINHP